MTDPSGLKATRREAKAERLAAALKANLRRRKEAERGRAKERQEPQNTEKVAKPGHTIQPHGAQPVESTQVANGAAQPAAPHDSAQITGDKHLP